MSKEPGYCRHRPTGQAYVRLGGKFFYLGQYGTQQSKENYNRLKSEWLVNPHAVAFSQSGCITMAELAIAYLDHAQVFYRSSKELDHCKRCLTPISMLYPRLNVEQFGPIQFETVRDWWRKLPSRRKPKRPGDPFPTCSRWYCNSQMKRLIRIVKWGVAKGMVTAAVYQTLKCVDPLKKGRCDAPEMEPVKPVSRATIDATKRGLVPVVQDMIEVQLLLGCRPGELVRITPNMIDRSKDVWEIKLLEHKTAYRDRERTIFVGPKAQAILTRYLLRGGDDPLFSPQEAMKQHRASIHEIRRTPLSCGNKPGSNVKAKPKKQPGNAYTTSSYSKAISTAAKTANLDVWTANQLRHTRATEIRSLFGLEATAAILGHSEIGVTQVYAEADIKRAIDVARKTG